MVAHFFLADSGGGMAVWAAVCFGILVIIYSLVRPMMHKKDPLTKLPTYGSLSAQRSVEREMQNVLVELSNMSRQVTAQLDTRAAKLEALIQEADEKIAALKALGASAAAKSSTAAGESSTSTPPPAQEPKSPALNPQHAEIYNLADQGRSPREIAQQLHRPSGEVELILALRN